MSHNTQYLRHFVKMLNMVKFSRYAIQRSYSRQIFANFTLGNYHTYTQKL